MTIGEKLKTLRKEKKITQKQLAELIDKNIRTIQKYESCEIKIPLESLIDISQALNVPLEYFNCFDKVQPTDFGNGVKAYGITSGKEFSCNSMIDYLFENYKNIWLGETKEEVKKICNIGINFFKHLNFDILFFLDEDDLFIVYIVDKNTNKYSSMYYKRFLLECEKINSFINQEIETINKIGNTEIIFEIPILKNK